MLRSGNFYVIVIKIAAKHLHWMTLFKGIGRWVESHPKSLSRWFTIIFGKRGLLISILRLRIRFIPAVLKVEEKLCYFLVVFFLLPPHANAKFFFVCVLIKLTVAKENWGLFLGENASKCKEKWLHLSGEIKMFYYY